MSLLARAGDRDLRSELAQRARAALASGLDGTLAPNQRASALEVLAQDGSDAEFDALEEALRAAEDAQLRRDLVRALGAARSPERGRRARALAFDPAVRSGELSTLLGSHFAWRENRAIGRAWFRGNEGAIFEKLPTLAAAHAPFLYATGACSEGDARDVETRFAERLATLEGGPRALGAAGGGDPALRRLAGAADTDGLRCGPPKPCRQRGAPRGPCPKQYLDSSPYLSLDSRPS